MCNPHLKPREWMTDSNPFDTFITLTKVNLIGLPAILTGQIAMTVTTLKNTARETFKISSTGRLGGRFIFPAAFRKASPGHN